jgi:hypothetical protein
MDIGKVIRIIEIPDPDDIPEAIPVPEWPQKRDEPIPVPNWPVQVPQEVR